VVFSCSLPLFLYTKPPDESTLEQLLPDDHIWTEGLGGSRENYMAACSRLQNCTLTLYTLQKNLINTLLINTDGCDHTPSSRKIFMKNLRKFVMENSLEHRVSSVLWFPSFFRVQADCVVLHFFCILA
jgi:Kip1 ubiquitination-promoting complex protein 1